MNMIELQSLDDKFNKLYPDERTMLLFEDVVLKRLKDRASALDDVVKAAEKDIGRALGTKRKDIENER